MSENGRTTYPGKNIDVTWDGQLCIHIGECGYSKGKLFVGGRDPWCQPDLVDDDNVFDVAINTPTLHISAMVSAKALMFRCMTYSLPGFKT